MVRSANWISTLFIAVYDGFDMLPVLKGKTNDAREMMFWNILRDEME